MSALMVMARTLLARGVPVAAVRRALPGLARVAGAGAVAGGVAGLIGGGGGGIAGRPPRRRRRKMFTDTDLAQFAAAGALVSKAQVAALMMIRAAKA